MISLIYDNKTKIQIFFYENYFSKGVFEAITLCCKQQVLNDRSKNVKIRQKGSFLKW